MPNLLTNVIIWAYGKYRDFFKISDYAVSKVYLEYYVDLDMKHEIDTFDDFWVHEKTHYWDEGESDFYIDVTNREFSGTEVPQNVTKTIFRVHYWYNNERYKYITYDPEFTWPPENNTGGVSFNLPITSATLVDEDDKPVRDVTRKVKRYAGPKGDFHGSDVKLSDLLFYDEDVLAEKYPKIQITNALGLKKVVSTLTGTTMNLRSP
jgi:hypothetical protein